MLKSKEYHLYNGNKIIGSFRYGDKLEIKLKDNLKEFDVPLDFINAYIEGKRVFNDAEVRKWVEQRVIPPSRQNIDSILKRIGAESYDPLKIFMYANGKWAQDWIRIGRIE